MAVVFPSDIGVAGSDPSISDELKTLLALKEGLSDDYAVYHSVHWSKASPRATTFGEIDFVVVNKAGSMLVIEQKNGLLEETPQGLEKSYGLKRKLVDSQIQRNIGNLRDKYGKQHPGKPGLRIDYIIFCPDYRVVNINAAGVDMSRTVDAPSKENLSKRIDQLLGKGNEKALDLTQEIHNFLLSSFRIAPDVNAYKSNQQQVYRHLLAGLSDVIDSLEFSPFRLRVIGTAGSGKTQVTINFCNQAVAKGRHPLLLCFNRPLADKMISLAPENVTINTYHGFCKDTAESLRIKIDFNKANEIGFWSGIQEKLVDADLDGIQKFDCLIVDEGQDFKPEWYEILQLFLNEDATQLWLEDPLQNLRGSDPVPLPGFVTYRDTANFRTPSLIANFIKNTLHSEFEQRNNLPGLGVEMYTYSQAAELDGILQDRVNELLKVGFKPEDVVIVSCRGMTSSALSEIESIGKHKIRRFTGKYDVNNNQIYTEGSLSFDTIFRFKGQQAPVIILVDLDESIENNDWVISVLYCAMTRATVRLELVVHDDCPWIDVFRNNL